MKSAQKNPRACALYEFGVFEKGQIPPDIYGVDTVIPKKLPKKELYEDFTFQNLTPNILEASRWRGLWAAPFHFSEPVHLCEARAALAAIKHRSRDSRMHSMHHSLIGDNLGVILAFQKGRCAHYPLLRLLQRACAEIVASGMCVHSRWTPSELNRSDGLSRMRESKLSPSGGCARPSRLRRHAEAVAGRAHSPALNESCAEVYIREDDYDRPGEAVSASLKLGHEVVHPASSGGVRDPRFDPEAELGDRRVVHHSLERFEEATRPAGASGALSEAKVGDGRFCQRREQEGWQEQDRFCAADPQDGSQAESPPGRVHEPARPCWSSGHSVISGGGRGSPARGEARLQLVEGGGCSQPPAGQRRTANYVHKATRHACEGGARSTSTFAACGSPPCLAGRADDPGIDRSDVGDFEGLSSASDILLGFRRQARPEVGLPSGPRQRSGRLGRLCFPGRGDGKPRRKAARRFGKVGDREYFRGLPPGPALQKSLAVLAKEVSSPVKAADARALHVGNQRLPWPPCTTASGWRSITRASSRRIYVRLPC